MVYWLLFKLFKVFITLRVFGDRDGLLAQGFFGFVFKHLIIFSRKSL